MPYKDPKAALEQVRRWRKANPERLKELWTRWNHTEPSKQRRREWSKENRAYYAAHHRMRTAKTGGRVCAQIRSIYERAAQWRKHGFDVVVDHIIALARGGSHTAKNLQIIYRRDNYKKGTTDWQPSMVFV